MARTKAPGDRARSAEEHEVESRLRTLLELAIRIGRREGLLSSGPTAKGEGNDSKDTE